MSRAELQDALIESTKIIEVIYNIKGNLEEALDLIEDLSHGGKSDV